MILEFAGVEVVPAGIMSVLQRVEGEWERQAYILLLGSELAGVEVVGLGCVGFHLETSEVW